MSDYLYRLEVSADKRSFTGEEAVRMTSAAVHPGDRPNVVKELWKEPLHAVPEGATYHPVPLEPADWTVLRTIWAGLDEPSFPMTFEQWAPYLRAYEASTNRPTDWRIHILRKTEIQTDVLRRLTEDEHRKLLRQAVMRGQVRTRNPLTGAEDPNDGFLRTDASILVRSQFKAFCDLLAIELADCPPHPCAAPASAIETPKQRRARLLQMHDAEVSAGRGRGALARITEIEKRTRPTADRSNIGKDIRKAREERDAERRGGALTRLLG